MISLFVILIIVEEFYRADPLESCREGVRLVEKGMVDELGDDLTVWIV
jgi:hypothetical protein